MSDLRPLWAAGEGAQPRAGGGEVVPHGPGDVRGRPQHPEVRAAGRRRETTQGAPRR